jgi:hypothetical protein
MHQHLDKCLATALAVATDETLFTLAQLVYCTVLLNGEAGVKTPRLLITFVIYVRGIYREGD